MMDKKAQFILAQKTLFMVVTLILISLGIIVLIIVLVNSNSAKSLEPLQGEIYSWQLINNPICFAYQNGCGGRVDLWTIDQNKFNNKTLHKCLFNSGPSYPHIPAQVTLINLDSGVTEVINTVRWSNAPTFKTTKRVLIKKDGVVNRGLITIELAPPKIEEKQTLGDFK